jgi:hypothetical protein
MHRIDKDGVYDGVYEHNMATYVVSRVHIDKFLYRQNHTNENNIDVYFWRHYL